MKTLGYYNGKYDELDRMMIPMNDRASYFGDGVYDATYSRNYKIFALREHIDRFYRSAEFMGIRIEQTKEELASILNDMLCKMDAGNQFVYFQVTRGTAMRNHAFPDDVKSNLWITLTPKNIVDTYKKVRLVTMEDKRFLYCNVKTINLLPSVLAAQKAKENDCDETVLHRAGRVTECAHSNVHIIKDGIFRTAPTDEYILPGIARAHLIEACKKLHVPVVEEPFSVDEMMEADEVIITSSGSLCLAAYEIDGKPVGGGATPLLTMLQNEVTQEFLRETFSDNC